MLARIDDGAGWREQRGDGEELRGALLREGHHVEGERAGEGVRHCGVSPRGLAATAGDESEMMDPEEKVSSNHASVMLNR